ncbi:hypothetical protein [Streptomyces sp. NBC_00500]|uniref:hypothetical protein n=1 Tax=Streptomyces sp. NBC_00500 TaxID=2975762 RepID=UPI0030DE76FD
MNLQSWWPPSARLRSNHTKPIASGCAANHRKKAAVQAAFFRPGRAAVSPITTGRPDSPAQPGECRVEHRTRCGLVVLITRHPHQVDVRIPGIQRPQ